MQIYGSFQGIPPKNSALFRLVSYNDPLVTPDNSL